MDRLKAIVILALLAGGVTLACVTDGAQPQSAATQVEQQQAEVEREVPAEQQAQQQQAGAYVGDVQSEGALTLPLSAAEKEAFCSDLSGFVARTRLIADEWRPGRPGDDLLTAHSPLIRSTEAVAEDMLDLYYQTNPPLDEVFLKLSELMDRQASTLRVQLEGLERIRDMDRLLAVEAGKVWGYVAEYCGP